MIRRCLDGIARLVRAVHASRYAVVVVRVLLVGAGLVVLALIGRLALPGASAAPTVITATSTPAPPAVTDSAWSAVAAPAESSAPAAPTAAATARLGPATPEDPVYLNQATMDDLRRLPGIGQKRALAVLSLRTRLGKFRQVEDLMKVRGIGRTTLKRLRPLVRLDAPKLPASSDAGAD